MPLKNLDDPLLHVPAFLHPGPPVQITGELGFSLAQFFGGEVNWIAWRRSGAVKG